jgi:hypothetical protein
MSEHATWPAERFYWCVLDAPGWMKTGVPPPGMLQRLEDELPVPPAEVHAVGTPLPDGRLLVCAARRDELEGVRALSLTPESLPDFVDGGDPSRLNLLVGAFEPAVVSGTRTRTHLVAAAAVLACGLAISAGLLRRASSWSGAAAALEREAAALTPPGAAEALTDQIAAAREAAQVAGAVGAPDSALALAAVLSGWPSSVACSPQSIAVDRSGASISVAVEGDPEPFLSALRPPPGWRLDEPRLVNVGATNRVSLKLRPAGGGS